MRPSSARRPWWRLPAPTVWQRWRTPAPAPSGPGGRWPVAAAVPGVGLAGVSAAPPHPPASAGGDVPAGSGTGSASAAPFRNPLNMGADPTLVFHDGWYYLSTTLG